VAITSVVDSTIATDPVTTAATVPVPVTVALAVGTTGPVWWEVGVSGAAALVVAVGVWRFLVSTQRRRRYDRVLGRVADLQLPARS
jgi:membrane protein implicated in regulation of membrane protease activity